MVLSKILFFILSSLLLINAFLTISVKNSIYSTLFLILSFLMATGLLFLLEIEFLALIFIIIYVGAISVLFLFVILMLNLKISNSTKDFIKYFPLLNFIGFIFLIELFIIIKDNYNSNPYNESFLINVNTNWFDKIDSLSDIEILGQILYTHYIIQFLLAGIILLIAVLGSIAITITKKSKNFRTQNSFRQISR